MNIKEFKIRQALGLIDPEDKLFKCSHCKEKTIFYQVSNRTDKFIYKFIPVPFCYIYVERWVCSICGIDITKTILQFKKSNKQRDTFIKFYL